MQNNNPNLNKLKQNKDITILIFIVVFLLAAGILAVQSCSHMTAHIPYYLLATGCSSALCYLIGNAVLNNLRGCLVLRNAK